VQLCTRYFCLDLFSIFRVIALHLENFCNFQLVFQVTEKGFDIVIEPYRQVLRQKANTLLTCFSQLHSKSNPGLYLVTFFQESDKRKDSQLKRS
jgi:hypothetical protein